MGTFHTGTSFSTCAPQAGAHTQKQCLMSNYNKDILESIVPKLSKQMEEYLLRIHMKGKTSFTDQDLISFDNARRRDKHKTFIDILTSKKDNDYELFLDYLHYASPKTAKALLRKETELVHSATLRHIRIGRLNNKTMMNIQDDSIDNCSRDNRNISVVLVGKTGSGKSSTGNTLVGKRGVFNIAKHFYNSCTDQIELEQTQIQNVCLKVMDTPGLFDTRGTVCQGMDDDSRLLEIAKAVIDFPNGIDVFLIVCRLDEPFTKETQNAIAQIEKRFGGNLHFYDHCILILTRGNEMQAHTLKEHFSKSDIPAPLSQLMEKVQNRVIVIENKWIKDDRFQSLQQEWLILQICTFVMHKNKIKRGKYTNKHFTIAQQLLKSKADNDLRKSSVRKYTVSFVGAYINGADEETMNRLMNDKILNESEMSKLKEFIEENILLTEHINVDLSALAGEIVSSSELIIQKQLFSKSRERETMNDLQTEKNKQELVSKAKCRMQISIIQFMDKNDDSMQILFDPNNIPRDIIDYGNECGNFTSIPHDDFRYLAMKVLSSMQTIVKTGIQKRQIELDFQQEIVSKDDSSNLTKEVLSVLKTLDVKDLTSNADSNQLKQSIIWQKLSTLKLNKTGDSENLNRTIINKHVDAYIKIKDTQRKEILRVENLLKVENIINRRLFEVIERGDEKTLADLINSESNQTLSEVLAEINLEEISESDIKSCFQLLIKSRMNMIKRRYNDVKTSRTELDKAINKHIKAEEKRDQTEQQINAIVEQSVDKFVRGLKKRDMLQMKEQFEANELPIPPKLFERIRKEILEISPLPDDEICRIINSVVISKKQILEEIMNQESCFPSNSLITTKHAGKITIDAVRLGDKVLTVKENSVLGFEEIFFIAHSNKSEFFPYLKFETFSKESIVISPNHCLPVGNIKCMAPANQVKVNDLIFINKDSKIIPDIVTSIKQEFRRGAHCPYTLNGTLVVDNIVASCFTTTVAPHIAQRVLFPLRCLYRFMPLPVYKLVFSSSNMKLVSEGAKMCSRKFTEHILLCIKKAP